MNIRLIQKEDRIDVVRLVDRVLCEFGFVGKTASLEKDLDATEHFWVAEIDGVICGTIAVRKIEDDDHTCELKRFYVASEYRGRGIGRALYAHAEDFARRASYARFFIDSSRRFVKAHAIYKQNGFVLLRELDNDWEDSEYEKWLAPRR
jgi:putative acetyltransferase